MLEPGRIMESLTSSGSTPGGTNRRDSKRGKDGVPVLEAAVECCRKERREGAAVVVVVVLGMEREKEEKEVRACE